MADLIEREKVVEILRIIGHGRPISGKRAISLISEMPTAEQPKQRHGRWIQSDALDYKDPNGIIHIHGMCSCCRLIYDFRDMTSRFKFCPNCGAKMDGGADNG